MKVAYDMDIKKIAKPTKFIGQILGQKTPKFSPEIGSKLRYIYLAKYMHDFYWDSSL